MAAYWDISFGRVILIAAVGVSSATAFSSKIQNPMVAIARRWMPAGMTATDALRSCGSGRAGDRVPCGPEGLAKQLAAGYTAAEWHNHSAADVASFFAGLDMAGPGITEAVNWRPWLPEPAFRHRDGHVLAGVARLLRTRDA
jgi:hypothetical protein